MHDHQAALSAILLMDALRKMTLMPARRLDGYVPQMKNKGRVKVGADADLAIFDANRVIDRATFEKPMQPSEGIVHVLVGGVFVVRDSLPVGSVYPGRAIRRKPADRNSVDGLHAVLLLPHLRREVQVHLLQRLHVGLPPGDRHPPEE